MDILALDGAQRYRKLEQALKAFEKIEGVVMIFARVRFAMAKSCEIRRKSRGLRGGISGGFPPSRNINGLNSAGVAIPA